MLNILFSNKIYSFRYIIFPFRGFSTSPTHNYTNWKLSEKNNLDQTVVCSQFRRRRRWKKKHFNAVRDIFNGTWHFNDCRDFRWLPADGMHYTFMCTTFDLFTFAIDAHQTWFFTRIEKNWQPNENDALPIIKVPFLEVPA